MRRICGKNGKNHYVAFHDEEDHWDDDEENEEDEDDNEDFYDETRWEASSEDDGAEGGK